MGDTVEEVSKGVLLHVDFHAPQRTEWFLFFPWQLPHLSVGRQIISHLEMKK